MRCLLCQFWGGFAMARRKSGERAVAWRERTRRVILGLSLTVDFRPFTRQ